MFFLKVCLQNISFASNFFFSFLFLFYVSQSLDIFLYFESFCDAAFVYSAGFLKFAISDGFKFIEGCL